MGKLLTEIFQRFGILSSSMFPFDMGFSLFIPPELRRVLVESEGSKAPDGKACKRFYKVVPGTAMSKCCLYLGHGIDSHMVGKTPVC